MQEFIAGFFKTFEERVNSTLYGAFLLALIVWNYDIFLTIFFVSNESIIDLEKMTKAVYIRDELYSNIWGVDTYIRYGNFLGRTIAFIYHIGIPVMLTYFMIWHVPELGTLARKKEKEFLKEREEENIKYKEIMAKFKLENSESQDAFLEKEENDAKRKKVQLDMVADNKDREIIIKRDGKNTNQIMSQPETNLYKKIVSNTTQLNLFKEMLVHIDIDNEEKLTIKEDLLISGNEHNKYKFFYNHDIAFWTPNPDEDKDGYFLYLQKLGKKIALQMVKDGYLKEADLIGKI